MQTLIGQPMFDGTDASGVTDEWERWWTEDVTPRADVSVETDNENSMDIITHAEPLDVPAVLEYLVISRRDEE